MMSSQRITWLAFILLSIASGIFSIKYFSQAMPLIHVDISMSREEALKSAQKLETAYNWGPSDYRMAASFDSDSQTQTYVELEAGGKTAFIQMIEGDLYAPYQWHVRLFKPHEAQETAVYFTPQGKPYGFTQKLSENTPADKNVDTHHARILAEHAANTDWQIDFNNFSLIESSQEERPSKRIDHTFTYERTHEKIGKATYRLKLVVSGDKLTELSHSVKVPETFLSQYQEMRSSNNSIAFVASILMYLLYILGGCIGGLFLLTRRNAVSWHIPSLFGFGIGFLQLLNSINQLPFYWMRYDTVNSPTSFMFQLGFSFILQFFFMSILIGVCAAAAESLTRMAFGKQLLLWNLWKSPLNHSYATLGRTVAGFLIVPTFVAFQIIFQMITVKYFGWWMPASPQSDPNILATYAPWLYSVANSFQAGFWEECLFRAVPLAGAALIGKYLGKERLMIAIAFIGQAVIFGAAHANYPNFPSYARIIELMIPSFMFGYVYLRYGLLPGIITHYIYDVFLFALPIFAGSFADNWLSQIMVIALSAIPLLIVVVARWNAGSWYTPTAADLNSSWQPTEQTSSAVQPHSAPESQHTLSPFTHKLLILSAALGLISWFIFTPTHNDAPAMHCSKQQAIEYARKELAKRNIALEDPWQPLVMLKQNQSLSDRFIWQNLDQKTFITLRDAHYLSEPLWIVRFVRFSGTVDERKEEFRVAIDGNGQTIEFHHVLPEAFAGEQLEQSQARALALTELHNTLQLTQSMITEISAQAKQLDTRRDWTFTFENNHMYPTNNGSARVDVVVAGNQIAQYSCYFHVPEEWERTEQHKDAIKNLIQTLCAIIIGAISVFGASIALNRWSKHALRIKAAIYAFILLGIICIIHLCNALPAVIASFNTTEPYQHQLMQNILSLGVQLFIFQAALYALALALLYSYNRSSSFTSGKRQLFISSIGLGIFNAGFLAFVKYFKPSFNPLWADYNSLITTMPIIGFMRNYFITGCSAIITLFLLFVAIDTLTRNGTSRRLAGIGALLAFGLCIAGSDELTSIPFWIIYGICTGILLCIEYYAILRFDLSMVPVMVAGMFSMRIAQQALFGALPWIWFSVALTILAIIIGTWYWFSALRSKN